MASLGLAFAAAIAAASAPAFGSGPSAATIAKASHPAPAPTPTTASKRTTGTCCSDSLTGGAAGAERPLSITVESGLNAGRLGLTGHEDGRAQIDPQTGAKQVGRNMVDLGGLTFQGKATITGQPLRPVRIELPQTVTLYSASGSEAELSDIRTDIPGVAMLDARGELQFSFGATISSRDGQGGNFKGRIPIRVEYY